jgi:hypothetical protein
MFHSLGKIIQAIDHIIKELQRWFKLFCSPKKLLLRKINIFNSIEFSFLTQIQLLPPVPLNSWDGLQKKKKSVGVNSQRMNLGLNNDRDYIKIMWKVYIKHQKAEKKMKYGKIYIEMVQVQFKMVKK